jgi:hypothetical protein
MSALNVFNANMLKFVETSAELVTGGTGGTSVGNPNAGNSNSDQVYTYAPPTPLFSVLFGGLMVGFRLRRRGIGF